MSLDDWFTPSEDYCEVSVINGSCIRMGKSFYDRLLLHPEVPLQYEITHAWIDDASGIPFIEDPLKIEDKWINKLRDFGHPKKKRKPKQQMPYWANNWRKK